jgi:hypothetical protein
MKILLLIPEKSNFRIPDIHIKIFPEERDGSSFPLEALLLATLLTPHMDCQIYDENKQGKCSNFSDFDWIALWADYSTLQRIKEVQKSITKQIPRQLVFGKGTSLLANCFFSEAELLLVGSIEGFFPKILPILQGSIGKKQIVMNSDYGRFIVPNRILLPNNYELIPFELGRGCKWQCDFCPTPQCYSGPKISKTMAEIKSEMAELSRIPPTGILMIMDDDFLLPIEPAQTFMNNIAKSGYNFIAKTRGESLLAEPNIEFPPQLQSLNVMVREKSDDPIPGTVMKQLIARLAKQKIRLEISILVGFPKDNHQTLKKILAFIDGLATMKVCIIPVVPLPGTPLGIDLTEQKLPTPQELLVKMVNQCQFSLAEYERFLTDALAILQKSGVKAIKKALME